MSNNNASPRPWCFREGLFDEECRIYDARDVAVVDFYDGEGSLGDADARLIVEAVNNYDRLREENETLNNVAANLQRSRASLIDDIICLRDLVRRLAEQLQDAVCLTPYDAIARALLREAREAIGEGIDPFTGEEQ